MAARAAGADRAAGAAGVIAVACSGGRDSTALLHATARAAAGSGWVVWALHVHHGLLPEADQWLEQLNHQCARWARQGLPVHLSSRRLAGGPGPGDSVEAWARRERYRALADMATAVGTSAVLLAHHQRDQAETFVLQALRGGAPKGLAAMPREAQRQGLLWLRPWLGHPSEAIAAYVRRYRLAHVDDPSNADPRLARSRLRTRVWPALVEAFADAEPCLAAAARRAHEAASALAELGAADLEAIAAAEGGLRRDAWGTLSPARRANVLRHAVAAWCGQAPPDSLINRLLAELPTAESGAQWPAPQGSLQLYRGVLRWARGVSAPVAAELRPAAHPTCDLSSPGAYPIPGWPGHCLSVEPCADDDGLPASLLAAAQWGVRSGGEQFQRAPGTPPRSLKKQFQAAGVPASQRGGCVLFHGKQLVFVPGLGLDARATALPGVPRRRLTVTVATAANFPTGACDG